MELIQCPDCSHKVSPRAVSCPQCGCPIAQIPPQEPSKQKPKPKVQQVKRSSTIEDGVKLGCGMFIVLPLLIIVGLIVLILVISAINDSTSNVSSNYSTKTNTPVTRAVAPRNTPIPDDVINLYAVKYDAEQILDKLKSSSNALQSSSLLEKISKFQLTSVLKEQTKDYSEYQQALILPYHEDYKASKNIVQSDALANMTPTEQRNTVIKLFTEASLLCDCMVAIHEENYAWFTE